MNTVELEAPLVEGQTATFRWRVSPQTILYHRSSFQMTFPDTVDLATVPARLWWDVMLICLHQHWVLLNPCRIHLPLALSTPEKAFWLQLMRTASETLGSVRIASRATGPREPFDIAFVDGPLAVPMTPIAGNGYGTAFSSGKDSLLQAALLMELTDDPLLVTTTSRLPPLDDHVTGRRRAIFAELAKRRNPAFVEVASDVRSGWNNGFAWETGYAISVNELTDTFVYMASLLIAGAALGRTRLFLASEAEVQENADVGGTIVQHPHFMYSAATQRALGRYLEPYGIRFGSLIWPLYSMQVQQLLWARYGDVSDLQYSCWRVRENEQTCSACEQCLRIAVTALASGHNPERMGIDLVKLMAYSPDWNPDIIEDETTTPPKRTTSTRARRLVAGAINRTGPLKVAAIALKADPSRLFEGRYRKALGQYRQLRRRLKDVPPPPVIGVRQAFFDWLDPTLRDRLVAIFSEHFPLEPRAEHADIFARSATVAGRAIATLDTPAS